MLFKHPDFIPKLLRGKFVFVAKVTAHHTNDPVIPNADRVRTAELSLSALEAVGAYVEVSLPLSM